MMDQELRAAQGRILTMLEHSKEQGRLSHAYLFAGPKGVKKNEMAHYFAAMLYCKEKKPCGVCASCQAILQDRHMNVMYIEPDGQSIKKEQIIALQEEFSKTSLVEGPRVYIIRHADKMSSSAANSLLKFLEEPQSEASHAILITERTDMILSTILSRSMVIQFSALPVSVMEQELLNQGVSASLAKVLPYVTNHTEDAIQLLEDSNLLEIYETILLYLSKLAKDESTGLFFREQYDILGKKDSLQIFLSLLELLYRDLYYYATQGYAFVFTEQELNLKQAISYYKPQELMLGLEEIIELERKLSYNININLFVIQLFTKLRGGQIV